MRVLAPLLLLVAFWPGLAHAQDDAPSAVVYADGWRWSSVTPNAARGQAFRSVATDPLRPDRAVALSRSGAVWLSEDGGSTWREVLRAPQGLGGEDAVDAEDVLLRAEAMAEDLFSETIDLTEDPEDFTTDPEDVESPAEEIIEIVSGEGLAVDQLVRDERGEGPVLEGGLVWFHPAGGVVLVSRSDGLWRSEDGGQRYQRVGAEAALTDLALGPDGAMLLAAAGPGSDGAADPGGIRFSLDGGRAWIHIGGPLDERPVADLALHPADALWYAAADDGLYVSSDGQTWAPLTAGRGFDTLALLPDPQVPGALWFTNPGEVRRTDDGGQRSFRLSAAPLPTTRQLLAGPTPGQLLLCGADGVWESVDGGVIWRPVTLGLTSPEVWAVARTQDGLLAVTERGIFRLDPPQTAATGLTSKPLPLGMEALLAASMGRPGMGMDSLNVSARRTALRQATPALIVRGEGYRRDGLDADWRSLTNDGDLQSYWRVTAQLTWGQGNSSTAGDTSFDLDNAPAGDLYYVVGDDVYATDDLSSVPSAAANISGASVQYRAMMADQIAELYFTRVRLTNEQAEQTGGDLRAQALFALQLAEIDALLDAYTDGALSLSAAGALPTDSTEEDSL
ncbi:MAG: hypothetical protein IPO67_03070 [Deltaproteobacteria bacterium]|nr:hypothetical protein [Deltaproteobacteria bacterium]MBK9644129.1 hypothetical protein [Deltaproteobacteria bacterium]